jgi:hypothetical protein
MTMTKVLTINLGTSMKNTLSMMSKLCQIDAIFLRFQLFGMLPFLAIVDVEGIIVATDNGQFARIIEIEGSNGSFRIVGFEPLAWTRQFRDFCRVFLGITRTLAGTKVLMISLTFWLGGA